MRATVTLTNDYTFHDANYACAAWWQQRHVAAGTYDATVTADIYGRPRAVATLPATIVDEDFGARFGGMPIVGAPQRKRTGEATTHRLVLEAAGIAKIARDGGRPDDRGICWWVELDGLWQPTERSYMSTEHVLSTAPRCQHCDEPVRRASRSERDAASDTAPDDLPEYLHVADGQDERCYASYPPRSDANPGWRGRWAWPRKSDWSHIPVTKTYLTLEKVAVPAVA